MGFLGVLIMKSRFYEEIAKNLNQVYTMGLQNYPRFAMEDYIKDKIKGYKKHYGY